MIAIVLLRGVNVSGKNKILMKDFVLLLQQNTIIKEVKSYIQSGNFVIKTDANLKEINQLITQLILEHYHYQIATFSYSFQDFVQIKNEHPFDIIDKRNYITFFEKPISTTAIQNLSNKDFELDPYQIEKNAIHTFYNISYSKSKLNNNVFEKQLETTATTRNWNTINKLISIAEAL